jgi:hypothetical protein
MLCFAIGHKTCPRLTRDNSRPLPGGGVVALLGLSRRCAPAICTVVGNLYARLWMQAALLLCAARLLSA